MHRSRLVLLAAISITFLLTISASAQNLLVNPDFDADVTTGWSGLGVWDPLDVFGSPASGSVTWINDWAIGGAHYHSQCVELGSDFEAFDLAGYAMIPSGQSVVGDTSLVVSFYSETGCETHISSWSTGEYTGVDNWELLVHTDWAPNGAVSARVNLANHKLDSGDFQTFHDSIHFGRNPEMLFADGFETMDTTEWSSDSGGAV